MANAKRSRQRLRVSVPLRHAHMPQTPSANISTPSATMTRKDQNTAAALGRSLIANQPVGTTRPSIMV